MSKLKLNVEELAVENIRHPDRERRRGTVVGAAARTGATPVGDTACTGPCMSGESLCGMESCGSACGAGSCWGNCEVQTAWGAA